MFVCTGCRASTVSETGRTIRFRIELGYVPICIISAVLLLINDTDASELGIVEKCFKISNKDSSLSLPCVSLSLISKSSSFCNTARGLNSCVYSEINETKSNWIGTMQRFRENYVYKSVDIQCDDE